MDMDQVLLRNAIAGKSDGETTDEYTSIFDWKTSGLKDKTIIVKNTGSNDMDIQLLTYAYENASSYDEFEQTISAGDCMKIILNNAYARVVVNAKSSVAGSSTTYEISWIGQVI